MFFCKYCEYSFKDGKKIRCGLYENQDVTGLNVDQRLCIIEPLEHYVEHLMQYVHHYPEGTRIKDLKFDKRAYITLVDQSGYKCVIRALEALKRYGDVLVLKRTYEAYYIYHLL